MKTALKLLLLSSNKIDENVMPKRRLMVFIDGENLVMRHQAMVQKGRKPISSVVHIPDVFVWHESVMTKGDYDVLRVTYYTYAVADDLGLASIRQQIKCQSIKHEYITSLPCKLTPQVFKKERKSAKAKGVDIQLTVDVLSHVYNNNVDAVFVLTGDGDYEPLFREVLRCGKQLYLAAFSDGLNSKLIDIADDFYSLDGHFFQS